MNDQKQPGAKRDSQPTSQQASQELLEHPEQLQMALEKIADEETAALPPIQIPTGDSDAQSGNDSGSHSGSHAPRRPRRRGRFLAYGAGRRCRNGSIRLCV